LAEQRHPAVRCLNFKAYRIACQALDEEAGISKIEIAAVARGARQGPVFRLVALPPFKAGVSHPATAVASHNGVEYRDQFVTIPGGDPKAVLA
jgi:hypothetical protein